MLEFLSRNWGSILVALIVLAVCGLACWRTYVRRKHGKCCGGDCGSCGCCPNSCEKREKP
ncbi:MAG: FeoB-associated Cys-rich membrane protein [Oscillospiraceae bacterium]